MMYNKRLGKFKKRKASLNFTTPARVTARLIRSNDIQFALFWKTMVVVWLETNSFSYTSSSIDA